MTATREDIESWVQEARNKKATHLIVAVDRYDHENYPVYVMPEQNVNEEIKRFNGDNMQGYDEVYSFTGKHDVKAQLAERRAIHFD